jgi:hypothetical protein
MLVMFHKLTIMILALKVVININLWLGCMKNRLSYEITIKSFDNLIWMRYHVLNYLLCILLSII